MSGRLKHAENDIFLEDVELEPGTRRGAHGDEGSSEHHSRGHKRKKRRWPIVLLLLVIAAVGVLLFNNFRTGRNWTIAVFGVDSRGDQLEEGTRSDVIMIVNVDRLTGDVKLCSVFRDTYLKIDEEGTYKKINVAYERGGHEQAIAALEENLDIEIDDYATFSWGTVATAINLMGGLDIEITDAEFRYINAFITETVEATGIGSYQLDHAGWNHLDGVQAVAYGRLRLMDTDFQRTARQRKVLSLMLDKVRMADKTALINMARVLIGEISTSVGIDDLIPVIGTAARFNIPEDGSSGFPFSRATEDIGSQNYVIPTTLESNVVMLHQFLFGDEDYTAPQSVKDISARISADSGYYEPGQTAPVPEVGGSGSGQQTEAPGAAEPQETEAPEESPEETESSSPEEGTEEGETETSEDGESSLAEGETGTEETGSTGEEPENGSEDQGTEEVGSPEEGDRDRGPESGNAHDKEDAAEDGKEGNSGSYGDSHGTITGGGPGSGAPSQQSPERPEGRPSGSEGAPVESPEGMTPGGSPSEDQESESVTESLSHLDKDTPVMGDDEGGPGAGM